MQCPRCGKDNLPELKQCFYCGAQLGAADAGFSVQPPRARQKNIAGITRRQTPRTPFSEWMGRVWPAAGALRFSGKDWLSIILGFLPGLSPLLQEKRRQAAINASAGVAFAAGIFLCWHHGLSNFFLMLFLLLVYGGLLQAIYLVFHKNNYPLTWPTLTASLFLSISLFMLIFFLAYWIPGRWFYFARIQGNQYAPTFNAGDMVIMRKNFYQVHEPQRNDLVVWSGNYVRPHGLPNIMATFLGLGYHGEYYQIDRIVAMQGDRVVVKDDKVLVNNVELSREQMPLAQIRMARGYSADFSITVPQGRFFTGNYAYGNLNYLQGDGWIRLTEQNVAYYLPYRDQIMGRVIYTLFPPSRRRSWQE